MNRSILITTDLRNMLRDKSLWILFLLPVLLSVLLRLLPPVYEVYVPEAAEYRSLILAFFCILCSTMAGFLMAFLMLDEKDQQLFQVFCIMPFNLSRLMIWRTLLMIALGFIYPFFLIRTCGLVEVRMLQSVFLALACSLSAPVNTLFIISLASNKIEGVTYFKLVNIIAMLPVIGLFITSPLRYIFGIIPYFWIYLAFENLADSMLSLALSCAGLIIQGIYLLAVFRFFIKRHEA
jgi:hypothetical protein